MLYLTQARWRMIGVMHDARAAVVVATPSLRMSCTSPGFYGTGPGPYQAHERLAPAALALARRIAGQATLQHLSEAGAGVADVAAVLWDELEDLSDRPV